MITIGPSDDVSAAVKILVDHGISALPVVDQDRHIVGVLSEATCFIATSRQEALPLVTRIDHAGDGLRQIARTKGIRAYVGEGGDGQ